jgi:hypothetical protein
MPDKEVYTDAQRAGVQETLNKFNTAFSTSQPYFEVALTSQKDKNHKNRHLANHFSTFFKKPGKISFY